MHAFTGILSQTIDMSPFTQRGQLCLFLPQVLVHTSRVRTLLWKQNKVPTTLSNFGELTILTCEATTKLDVVSAVTLLLSSTAASAVDGTSSSPDVPISQGQSRRS